MMEVQLSAFRKFPDVVFIPGCWPDYGTGLFSAWGGRICWADNTMPSVREKYLTSKQHICDFHPPDPHTDGLMPWHLETLKRFVARKAEFNGNLHFIHSNGPGELASYLWGMDAFLQDLYFAPELMKTLLSKVTETVTAWLSAQSVLLPDCAGMLITDDLAGLMSADMYRQFLLPYHRLIREKFPELIYVLHCDSRTDHVLSIFPDAGIDVFQVGVTTNLANAKELIGRQVCLMGNIDGVEVMQRGNAEAVRRAAEKCLAQAISNGGYFLSTGGGLNEDTPEENIRVLVEVAQSKGAYS
jgi:uroporphyrinogen decarboxylase